MKVLVFEITKILFDKKDYDSSQLEFDVSKCILIVGPNNSGKSRALRTIYNNCIRYGEKISVWENKLVKSITLKNEQITKEEKERLLKEHPYNETSSNGSISFYESETRTFRQYNANDTVDNSIKNWLRFYSLFIDGKSRFDLISDVDIDNFQQAPTNALSHIFRSDKIRQEIQGIIHNEFGYYFYIDITKGKRMGIVLTKEKIDNEKCLDNKSLESFKNATPIEQYGDGIKAFIGIIITFFLNKKIIIIDEPEVFLHPPTAYSLGRQISTFSKANDLTVCISTHSADFIHGMLEGRRDITIFRLTYNEKGEVRVIDNNLIRNIYNDPFLRSNNVINGIFHSSIVIVEGGNDRLIYSEVNRKLVQTDDGIIDTIFLDAMGKDKIQRIANPFYQIGIPVVCVYDFDLLRFSDEAKKNFKLVNEILRIKGFSEEDSATMISEIDSIENELKGLNDKKEKGYPDIFYNLKKFKKPDKITSTLQSKIDKVLRKFKEKGIFIVPNGELESWFESIDTEEMLKELNDGKSSAINDLGCFITEMKKFISQV